jgi:hypothetical protein
LSAPSSKRSIAIQIRAHREFALEGARELHCARGARLELLGHRLLGEIGDVPEHAGHGESDVGAAAGVVILPAGEVGIAQDGVAPDHVEGDGLAREVHRRRDRNHRFDPLRVKRRPGQHLMPPERSAHDRAQLLDPEVIDQLELRLHHVADRDGRKVRAVAFARGRIAAVRTRRAAAPPEYVRADREIPIRVDVLARPDEHLPPARIIVLVVTRHVGVAAQGVADQDRVVLRRRELAVGLVGERNFGKLSAQLERKRFGQSKDLCVLEWTRRTQSVAALENVVSHGSRVSDGPTAVRIGKR